MKKNIIAGGVGTLLEWAEFSFYAYLINKLSQLFFAKLPVNLALLLGFGTFAISYLARPLGGLIFGYIGDRVGRKIALADSMALMGVATFIIGVLPVYQSIGILSPILLIVLRFMQGLAVAGEFTGAAIFLAEHDDNKTYLTSAWVSTFAALGMLIGAGASVIISLPTMPEWAWRVPFILLGSAGIVLGIFVYFFLNETPTFKQTEENEKIQLFSVLAKHFKLPVVKTIFLAAFVGINIYICNVWWVTYVIQQQYFSVIQAKSLATFALAAVVVFTPLLAIVAQKIGGQLVMQIGLLGAALSAFLLFGLTLTHDVLIVAAAQVLYALFNAAVTAVMFKYLVGLFTAHIRFSGQAIGWNIGIALFGGTAPLIVQMLTSIHTIYAAAFYVATSAVIALLITSLIKTQN